MSKRKVYHLTRKELLVAARAAQKYPSGHAGCWSVRYRRLLYKICYAINTGEITVETC